ncbi:unnamed protein product [Sphagnum troendelagicum]
MQQQQRGSDDDRSSASAAGSFRSSFLQTGDTAESKRKDSHWPIAAQGSFRWENEPGPNQVNPVGRGTRAKPGHSGAKMNQRETSSASGKRNEANPGQSSGKKNQGETRSVQWEEERGPN